MGAFLYGFDGKRAVVVGGATGMGAAAAVLLRDLGAVVVVLDVADCTIEGVQSVHVDLRSKESIDGALAQVGGSIDVLLACAGVADGVEGIERINFLAHRHFIDQAVALGHLGRGGAIGLISSTAGLGWQRDMELLGEYLDTPDFDAGVSWIQEHPDLASYMWSKAAINMYVAREAFALLKQGIRVNAIMPGPTDTPLAQAHGDLWLGFGADYRSAVGVEASSPEEQASVLVFLCSAAASHVSGVTVITDAGYTSAGLTGSFPPAQPFVHGILGLH